MWSGINRRKFPRAKYRCLISIGRKDAAKSISTHTENVGAGGICVIVPENLGLFQGVELEIDMEDGFPSNIRCSGTVVWVVKKSAITKQGPVQYDTGIEFVDIEEKDKARISKIVEKQLENTKKNAC